MAQNKNNKPNSGLYVAVFFVFVILIVIMFFVKKDNILSNLKKTNFFERVGVATPEFVEKHPVEQEKTLPDDIEIDLMDDAASEKTINQQENPASVEKSAKTDSAAESFALPEKQPEIASEKKEENKPAVSAEKTEPSSKNSSVPAAPKPASATRTATLYFVSIGADGSVSRQAVKRQLTKSDSPLADAIKALLAGPVPGEKNAMSLIPSGSRLIGASVKDGVATLNFNESFEFNSYGVE